MAESAQLSGLHDTELDDWVYVKGRKTGHEGAQVFVNLLLALASIPSSEQSSSSVSCNPSY